MTTITAHLRRATEAPMAAPATRFVSLWTTDRDTLEDTAPVERRPGGDSMESRAIERSAAMLAGVGILAATLLTGSCAQVLGIEDLPPLELVDAAPSQPADATLPDAAIPDTGPSDFAVRGTAAGVLEPVALELRLGSATEVLAVEQDGAFAFQARLETGASYTVVLANPALPCTLRNETGVVAGADTAIELTCAGASLASLVVSGLAPTVTLVPGTTEYVIDLPLSEADVTLTATVATPGDTMTIAGVSVPDGAPSAPITLSLGDNPVDIVVENDLGWQRTYRLTLRRASQLAQYAYGKASNTEADDELGYSVALSGDTLAVGAHFEASAATGANGNQDDNTRFHSGAVYVFRRAGLIWQQEAYLKASNTGTGDEFGHSVALSGDTLVVGARREDSAATGIGGNQNDDNASNSGAVFVFRRTGTTWQQEAYVKAANTGAGDEFGYSVALSGDTLAVGAPREDSVATGVNGNPGDNTTADSGAVYVFRRVGTAWQQEAYVKASNTGVGDELGISVALSGDILAVGAHHEDSGSLGINGSQVDNSALDSGAVYVFRRSGTAWQQEAYVKASNTESEDLFGTSVALSGDTLAVGAKYEGSAATGINGDQGNGAGFSGAVYVFRRTGTTWQQEAYIKASNTGVSDLFGSSVSLSGDTLAVGAYSEDSAATGVDGNQGDNSVDSSGAAYVFRRTGATWQQAAYVKASNTGASDYFGFGVAVSNDTLAVGACLEDSASQGVNGNQADDSTEDSGAVYIFH
jgi:hypothetical protein